MRSLGVLVLALALGACAALPRSGPTTSAILQAGQAGAARGGAFQLVELTTSVAAQLDRQVPSRRLVATVAALPPPRPLGRIAPGDLLHLVFWEANPSGTTLLTQPGLDTTLPVGASGVVDVPYAGPLRVDGLSPRQVQSTLARRFTTQGYHIQVAVRDAASPGDSVIVQGEVARPGRYPLAFGARSLLDLLALAGGPKLPAYATDLRITRAGHQVVLPLSDVIAQRRLNVALGPGDQLMVLPHRLFFYALGAVNRPGAHAYLGHRMTLVEALGKLAGLQDNLATPRGVFIYRRSAATLTPRPLSGAAARAQTVPRQVVYRLDMAKPDSFFVADRFLIRPDDIIYVTDAPMADVAKVLQVISGVSGVAVIPHNFGVPY